ncbi:helix-hairpin-helix domain-containing protein [Amphibiibacter pelophylacis]|uniref:Helix-hairpin-helix domain-containing protein n=1 Tax=Amphibiibacter pelophylacis TaxID=1799477 RepID=A0ACC6NYI9_9BURK
MSKAPPKAQVAAEAQRLTDIPNIGVSLAADLRGIGIDTPQQVRDMDPRAAYERLRGPMGRRHDPCVLDVFLAAHDFMNGGPRQPWWHFTAQRKALMAQFSSI